MKNLTIIFVILILLSACSSNNENDNIIISTRKPDSYLNEIPFEFKEYETNIGYQDFILDSSLDITIGIDVSSHNNEIFWNQVTNTDIEFAFVRLGYRGYQSGSLIVDDYYYYNMDETEHYNIDNGVYFVTQAVNNDEAIEEANFILGKIRGYDLELPIVIDIEEVINDDNRVKDLTPQQRTDILIILLETLKTNDYSVLIYSNEYFLNNYLELDRLSDYDLWIANYSELPETISQFTIWQYSANGFVSGIYNNVDLNVKFNK